MFKELYHTIISLIFKPAEAWKSMNKMRTANDEIFLSRYVYPLTGIITLTAFLGILFTRKEFDLQIALKSAILALLSVLGGFFLASYFVNEIWRKLFNRKSNMKLCMRFVGYSSSLMFALNILLNLFPEFFFLRFLVLYTIYIIWEGAVPYMNVEDSEQLKFVSSSTIIIIVTPLALEFILRLLMPGLRV